MAVVHVTQSSSFPIAMVAGNEYVVDEDLSLDSGDFFTLNADNVTLRSEVPVTITYAVSGNGSVVNAGGNAFDGFTASGPMTWKHGGYVTAGSVRAFNGFNGGGAGNVFDGIEVDVGVAGASTAAAVYGIVCDLSGVGCDVRNCTLIGRGPHIVLFQCETDAWPKFHGNTIYLRDAGPHAGGGYLRGTLAKVENLYGNTVHIIDCQFDTVGVIPFYGQKYAHGNTIFHTNSDSTRVFIYENGHDHDWCLYNRLTTDNGAFAFCRMRFGATFIALGFNTCSASSGGSRDDMSLLFYGSDVPAGIAHDCFVYENYFSGGGVPVKIEETAYGLTSWDNELIGPAGSPAISFRPYPGTHIYQCYFIGDVFTAGAGADDIAFISYGTDVDEIEFNGCNGGAPLTYDNQIPITPGVDYFDDFTTPPATATKPYLGLTPNAPTGIVVT